MQSAIFRFAQRAVKILTAYYYSIQAAFVKRTVRHTQGITSTPVHLYPGEKNTQEETGVAEMHGSAGLRKEDTGVVCGEA